MSATDVHQPDGGAGRPRAVRHRSAAVALALTAVVGCLAACGGGAAPAASPATPTPTPADARPAPAAATAAALGRLKLVNYYPSTGGWSYMWTRWDPAKIDSDFRRIAQLGGTAVRVILQPTAVGFPAMNPVMASHLATVVAAAHHDGLAVQLTLFDQWSDYGQVGRSSAWAASVLAPYRSDPRIAFVELQNEIDPTNAAAMAWARRELPVLRGLAGSVPVTVSVTGVDTATTLTALQAALAPVRPDFWDVHFYSSAGSAYSQLAHDQLLAAPLPLFVGETGRSSSVAPGASAALAEADQDLYLRTVEWAALYLGLPTAAPWILQDFAPGAIPPDVHARADQYAFGLLRVDGTAKPAAAAFGAVFATGVVPTDTNLDFAAGDAGRPLYWQVFDPGQGTFLWDPTSSARGGGSAGLRQTTGSSAQVPGYVLDPVVVPTRPGQTFAASAWVRGDAATGSNRLSISWFGAAGTYLGKTESADAPVGTTGWTHLTVTSPAPPGAEYEQLHLESSGNTGTVWFSDAQIAPTD